MNLFYFIKFLFLIIIYLFHYFIMNKKKITLKIKKNSNLLQYPKFTPNSYNLKKFKN